MKTIIYKTRNVGASSFIAPANSVLKLHHLLCYVPIIPHVLGREGDLAMLIGQVALVEYSKRPAGEVQVARYIYVVHQRTTDVVDLTAAVFTARVWKEESCLLRNRAGGQVDNIPLHILPDSVELGFNVNVCDVPDSPAYQLFSAMRDDVLWNNTEAFLHWLSEHRLVRNQDGSLLLSHMVTKVDHVS